jgi:hypothetical protein
MDFLGYRRSETHDDYVEWGGPAGWFILRPAREGAAGKAHDRTASSWSWPIPRRHDHYES